MVMTSRCEYDVDRAKPSLGGLCNMVSTGMEGQWHQCLFIYNTEFLTVSFLRVISKRPAGSDGGDVFGTLISTSCGILDLRRARGAFDNVLTHGQCHGKAHGNKPAPRHAGCVHGAG